MKHITKFKNFLNEEKIRGGKGDKLDPKDVDSKELAVGIEVEYEHSHDKETAQDIALDHLKENPKYYKKLLLSGLVDEPKMAKDFWGIDVKESIVNRKKDQEIFNYNSIIENAWRPIIKKAQKFQKIYFDLENNDSTGEKKTIYIKKNLRKNQPVKYEINAELWEAGGDWECPVLYFRIELTRQYSIINNKYQKQPEYVWDLPKENYNGLYNCFVLIPDSENGNNLVKTKNGYTAYTNDSLKAAGLKNWKDVKNDKQKAWKWLEKLLNKVVNDRHEMLDEPNKSKISDIKKS